MQCVRKFHVQLRLCDGLRAEALRPVVHGADLGLRRHACSGLEVVRELVGLVKRVVINLMRPRVSASVDDVLLLIELRQLIVNELLELPLHLLILLEAMPFELRRVAEGMLALLLIL